jgi:hypothetical protein
MPPMNMPRSSQVSRSRGGRAAWPRAARPARWSARVITVPVVLRYFGVSARLDRSRPVNATIWLSRLRIGNMTRSRSTSMIRPLLALVAGLRGAAADPARAGVRP